MNLSQKLDTVIQAKDDIREAIISKGVIPSGNITTYASAIEELSQVHNQTKTVTQNGQVTYDAGYTGLEKVNVNLPLGSKTINTNNTYTASSEGLQGYSSVTVDVEPLLTTKVISENGTYAASSEGVDGYSSVTVATPIPIGPVREVSSGEVYQMPASNVTFSLPSNAKDVGTYALAYAFYGCTGITGVDLSSLTRLSGRNAFYEAFYICTSLTNVNLSSLASASGSQAFAYAFCECSSLTSVDLRNLTTVTSSVFNSAFQNCSALTSINLSSLTSVSGGGFNSAFLNCSALTSINLSSLTSVSGTRDFERAFYCCTSLTSIDLSNLVSITGSSGFNSAFDSTAINTMSFNSLSNIPGSGVFQYAFQNCLNLTSLSFPALTANSFGSNTNQFNNMLSGCSGVTVHFPSNLQSVIGSWSSVTAGFGGTNTTVLFDLPATT